MQQLIEVDMPHPSVPLPRSLLAVRKVMRVKHGRDVQNVPGAGECVVHVASRAFACRIGRPTTLLEVRCLMVGTMRRPQFADALRCDANCDRRRTSSEQLLGSFAVPGTFLPPILAARAIELFAGISVRLFATGTGGEDKPVCDAVEVYRTDGAERFDLEFVHVESAQHVLLAFPRCSDATTDDEADTDDEKRDS